MPDEQPQARGGFGIPLPLILGGIGVVAVIWYLHSRGSGANTGTATTSGVPIATDPNTGLPIDTYTGLPYVTSQPSTTTDLTTWVQQAESALVSAGYSPALASQSLYDYANQNQLSSAEAGAVNKALGLVGFAPQQLPFLGTVPTPTTLRPLEKGETFTSATFKTLPAAIRRQYQAVRTAQGANVYIPKTVALPTGATKR